METNAKRKFDLEERLIDYAVLIIQIADNMIDTRAGNHIAGQIVRSGTHPALHYGEAQSAESRQDFIHKLKVLLKELRETKISLIIIKKTNLYLEDENINFAIKESDELVANFVKSVETATKNMELEKKAKTISPK